MPFPQGLKTLFVGKRTVLLIIVGSALPRAVSRARGLDVGVEVGERGEHCRRRRGSGFWELSASHSLLPTDFPSFRFPRGPVPAALLFSLGKLGD